jgi:hypothetical protein
MKRYLLLAISAAGAFAIFHLASAEKNDPPNQTVTLAPQTESSNKADRTFAGYDCSDDCSGHEAGYKWAEEKDIQDDADCEAAGEHSNSPSFEEGCKAYVNGEGESESENADADKPESGSSETDDSDDSEDDDQ